MKHLIKVTEKHIENGKPMGTRDCPVALALTDALGNLDVNVGYNDFYYGDPEDRKLAKLPEAAQSFIHRHTNHRDGQPFEFEIEL